MLRSGGIIPLHRRAGYFVEVCNFENRLRSGSEFPDPETGAGCVSGEAPEIAALLQLTHSACALSGALATQTTVLPVCNSPLWLSEMTRSWRVRVRISEDDAELGDAESAKNHGPKAGQGRQRAGAPSLTTV